MKNPNSPQSLFARPLMRSLSMIVFMTLSASPGMVTAQSTLLQKLTQKTSEATLEPGTSAAIPAQTEPITYRSYEFHSLRKFQLYDPVGIKHSSNSMSWYYNDANRPAGAPSKAAVISQIMASMAKWTAVCNITFNYLGETTAVPNAAGSGQPFDGVNVIGWDPTGLTAPTTGITNVWYTGSVGTTKGSFVDVDIRLNAAYATTYTPASFLDATLTHEVGHALGLQHSDVAGQLMSGPPLTSYVNGATALQADDIAGCVALYGAPGGAPTCSGPQPPNDSQTLACPAGQVGSITQQRSYTCVGTAWTPGSYVTTSNTCTTPTCTPPQPAAEQQTLACPAGQVGSITQQRTYSCVGTTWTPSAYVTIANTCTTPTCTPPQPATEQQTLSCPAGQVGSIVQQRSYTCVGTTWTPGAFVTITNTCVPSSCSSPKPADDQLLVGCPAGQTGSILQQRTYTCVAGNWTPGSYQTVTNSCVSQAAPPAGLPGAWWAGSTENGWGLSFIQHNNVLVAGWYYFGANGQPTWLIMPGCTWNNSFTSCTGQLYVSSGAWLGNYSTAPLLQTLTGSVTFSFTSGQAGTMQWTVNGVPGVKSISKLALGGTGSAPTGLDYTDAWWGGTSQNGWGVALIQEGSTLVGAWYTYSQSGQPVWYLIQGGQWTNSNTYSASLVRATGSPLIGTTYNAALFQGSVAGSITLVFTSATTATMTYTVDGVTQTKSISRQVF